jgi:hypothetical protein
LLPLDGALATAAGSGVRGWNAEIHRLRGELTARLPCPDPAKAEDFHQRLQLHTPEIAHEYPRLFRGDGIGARRYH